jgi:uncharacterized protein YbjT (DUF2867 family)
MASATNNVLVFGPTGAVGCATALEARRRGAHVWLAMRDPKKPISGLNDSETGYTRIQADLSESETVANAVQKSSAKIAFIYVVHTSADNMAATFSAMKEAGITYIVLLSSFSVQEPVDSDVNMNDFIPAVHAKTEIALRNSGIAYAAIRPFYFNSNVMWYLQGIKEGQVGLLYPHITFDFIAPSDIGTACGAILATPELQTPDEGQADSKVIDLCGPTLLTQYQAYAIMSEALGREIKVKELDEDQFREKLSFFPKPALDAVIGGMRESHEGREPFNRDERYDAAVANLRKYKGAEPMQFGEWVVANKAAFA